VSNMDASWCEALNIVRLKTCVSSDANTMVGLFGAESHMRRRLLYMSGCYLPGDFPEAAFQAWAKSRAVELSAG